MNRIESTPIQIFRNHLRLREILNVTGEILAFTKIARTYTGIIKLDNGIKLPIKIKGNENLKIGSRAKIMPCLQGVNSQKLREYGVIAEIC